MNILTIAIKDLKQIARDKMSALFLVILPLGFTLLMGMLFGGTSQTETRLNVGLINNDPAGVLASDWVASLNESQVVKITPLTPADAASLGDRINNGKLAAAVIIPAGFSDGLFASTNPQLTVVADPTGSAGRTVITEVGSRFNHLQGALEIASLSLQAHTSQAPVQDAAAYQLDSITTVLAAWQAPAVSITSQPVSAAASKVGISGFSQTSPGMLFQFSIAGLIGAAAVLVLERRNRTVSRMLVAPVSKAEIILGHLLGVTVTVFLQETILILAGQFFFKVNYLQNLPATALMMLVVALFCGCLGLFFGAISRKPEQAIMWPLIAMFLLTALGGAWFPLDVASKTFNLIGHFTPGAWVMDGFQNIVLRGLGFSSVLPPAAILLGFAALFFALAVWRFKFE